MSTLLRFFTTYESVFYIILGAAFLLYLLRFLRAWQDLQRAVFGLEREQAQHQVRSAFTGMLLSLGFMLAVFTLTTFIAPTAPLPPSGSPGLSPSSPEEALPTETTLPTPTPTPLPTPELDTGGCIEGQVLITNPKQGAIVSGKVTIEGTANIPNFGFYKVEFAPAREALFLTLEVRHAPQLDGPLVTDWDTSNLPQGDYVIQLVVTDNEGNALPPCRVRIHIVPPAQTP